MNAITSTNTVYILHQDTVTIHLISQMLAVVDIKTVGLHSPDELLHRLPLSAPSTLLVDFILPGMSGIQLIDELRKRNCHGPVIFMSSKADPVMIAKGMNSGGFGFIKRPFHQIDLLEMVQRALARDFSQYRYRKTGTEFQRKISRLTTREQTILDLLIHDLTAKQIGVKLEISHRTVENHRVKILEKMEIGSTIQLVRQATVAEIVGKFI